MMAARRPLIAGNWKMYKGGPAGVELAIAAARLSPEVPGVDLVVAPPFTVLAACAQAIDENGGNVGVSAQNLYPKDEGAFTGEISAPMLKDCGCTFVILGHSERRQHFG